jgi:hypothetical protein
VWIAGKWLDGPAFEVADPKEMKERVEIEGSTSMSFLIQAEKVQDKVVFARWPQQSDYAAAWTTGLNANYRDSSRLTTVQCAGKAYKTIKRYSGAIGRVAARVKGRTTWKYRCLGNPALKLHKWSV